MVFIFYGACFLLQLRIPVILFDTGQAQIATRFWKRPRAVGISRSRIDAASVVGASSDKYGKFLLAP